MVHGATRENARYCASRFMRPIMQQHSSQLMECLYYAYGSTANFLAIGPMALICISKERRCRAELREVRNCKIERVIGELRRFF